MEFDVEAKGRNVIPRWRDFLTTLSLGELHSSLKGQGDEVHILGTIDEQINDWRNNRTLSFAMDLVGSGLVLGNIDDIDDAADFVLSPESKATDFQKRIARRAKDPNCFIRLSIAEELANHSSDEVISQSRTRVKKLRAQIREAPRNPIKLVELSREFATLGSLKNAEWAMDIAVALAPANRFVLRSAARLYLHADKPEKAHYVLKRAPSLRSDPWLLAAEIAVASTMERSSGIVHIGMAQLDSENYDAFETSELASAIATLEMSNANSKLARKRFRQSLLKPTENSIAQAEWASRLMQNLTVEVQQFNAPRNYEALSKSYYKQENWDNALNQGKNWIFDQPFAVSPIYFTGHVAIALEDFALSEKIVRFGIHANPQNVMLRNNLAFILASTDEPDLAEKELVRIERADLDASERAVLTATEGLIRFRKGYPKEGRVLYRRAIDLAMENKEPGLALRALVFLTREEINARTAVAVQTLEQAERELKRFESTQDLRRLFNKLKAAVESDPEVFRMVRKMSENTDRIATKALRSSE